MPSDFDKYLENLTDDQRSQFDQAKQVGDNQADQLNDLQSSQEQDSQTPEVVGAAGNEAGVNFGEDSSGPEVAPTTPGAEPQPEAPAPKLDPDLESQVDNTPSEPSPNNDNTPPATDQTVQKDSLAAYPEAAPNQQQDNLQQEQQRQNDGMEM